MTNLLYRHTIDLPTSQTQVRLHDVIVVEKPAGFSGQLNLSGFERLFELQVSQRGNSLIDAQHPLRLCIPLNTDQIDDVQEWLPVVRSASGDEQHVLGYCSVDETTQELRVTLTELPAAHETVLIERLEEPWMPMGLREAVVDQWGVHYEEIAPSRLRDAHAIALFVPGYMGNTSWMVHGLYPYLSDELDEYHTLLVFNYDWLGSSCEDMAQLMASQLIEAGIAEANSKVDIFAYSLGCLVARAAVEMAGVADYTRNVVLLGSPSAGTPLATLPRRVPQFASGMLSRLGTLSLARSMRRFARQIYSHLESLQDLEPDSPLMEKLRSAKHPAEIRYLVVAGDNDADEAQLNFVSRIVTKALDSTLDYYFDGQNDGVVAVESALYLHPKEPTGLITRQIVPCNHYGFFGDEATRAAIQAFLEQE